MLRCAQALLDLVWDLTGARGALPLPALSPLAPGSREARKKLEEQAEEEESDADLLCSDLVQVPYAYAYALALTWKAASGSVVSEFELVCHCLLYSTTTLLRLQYEIQLFSLALELRHWALVFT